MTEYHSLANAALGVHVRPVTLRRWIENGWLTWPKPYRQHPQDHGKLIAIRDENQARKGRLIREHLVKRRKYFTAEERSQANMRAVKRYRQANPERVREEYRMSHALKRHPFFAEMKEEMIAFYGDRCLACKRRKSRCMDHIEPLSMMGENHPRNLQPLCIPCNTAKAGKRIDHRPDHGEWALQRWGGWKVNGGRKATGAKGSARHSAWLKEHQESVMEWRLTSHNPQEPIT